MLRQQYKPDEKTFVGIRVGQFKVLGNFGQCATGVMAYMTSSVLPDAEECVLAAQVDLAVQNGGRGDEHLVRERIGSEYL